MKRFAKSLASWLFLLCLLVTAAACRSQADPQTESQIDPQTETENGLTAQSEQARQRMKEKNEQALAGEYAAVNPEKCVGKFKSPVSPFPSVFLYDDGKFSLWSALSSYKTQISGTWRIEGNELITEVVGVFPPYSELDPKKPEDIRLSFDFLNEDVLVFHPDRSSDLSDFLIGFKEDTAFIRGEMPDFTE